MTARIRSPSCIATIFVIAWHLATIPISKASFITFPSNSGIRPLQHALSTATSSHSTISKSDDSSVTFKHQEEALEKGDDVSLQSIEFPPPLSKLDRVKRASQFWSAALPIIFSYYSKNMELDLRSKLFNESFTPSQYHDIWNKQHEMGSAKLADVITKLMGFYVKTAQIIASRQDLFPRQYTEALSGFTDNFDPMPSTLARVVVQKELLAPMNLTFSQVFVEFDDVPLGAASVAQVHRAILSPEFGGHEVAIKIQRPYIESKLMGDIANLKAIAKTLQEIPNLLPLDYYKVFCELENQLAGEFDFIKERDAMDRIYQTVASEGKMPLVIPRPVDGFVSKRVLVMEHLDGIPLSRVREEMIQKGIDPDGPEAKLFGRKLLRALTDVFGRCILETGFFHADPHPGNIFVLKDGDIGLIDFGQVKQISDKARITIAKVIVALDDRKGDTDPNDLKRIGDLAVELGVEIKGDAKPEAASATAMWLFDGSVETLPGGYDKGELSPNSPVKELKSFPQDLVLVGRSTVLIKGLSARLNVPWSLSKEWAPIARAVLSGKVRAAHSADENRLSRLHRLWRKLKKWGEKRISVTVTKMPSPIRKRVTALALRRQEQRAKK